MEDDPRIFRNTRDIQDGRVTNIAAEIKANKPTQSSIETGALFKNHDSDSQVNVRFDEKPNTKISEHPLQKHLSSIVESASKRLENFRERPTRAFVDNLVSLRGYPEFKLILKISNKYPEFKTLLATITIAQGQDLKHSKQVLIESLHYNPEMFKVFKEVVADIEETTEFHDQVRLILSFMKDIFIVARYIRRLEEVESRHTFSLKAVPGSAQKLVHLNKPDKTKGRQRIHDAAENPKFKKFLLGLAFCSEDHSSTFDKLKNSTGELWNNLKKGSLIVDRPEFDTAKIYNYLFAHKNTPELEDLINILLRPQRRNRESFPVYLLVLVIPLVLTGLITAKDLNVEKPYLKTKGGNREQINHDDSKKVKTPTKAKTSLGDNHSGKVIEKPSLLREYLEKFRSTMQPVNSVTTTDINNPSVKAKHP